jgi:hypothetical protein
MNNTTAVGIVNISIKKQGSQLMEMRYFWLLNQASQKYFKFFYQPGAELMAEYPSKAHVGPIHIHVCSYYLHMENSPIQLTRASPPSARQRCIALLGDPYNKGIPLPRIPNLLCARQRLPIDPYDLSGSNVRWLYSTDTQQLL